MTSQSDASQSVTHSQSKVSPADPSNGWQAVWIFAGWCLRRETLKFYPYLAYITPVSIAALFGGFVLARPWQPSQGILLFETLCAVAVVCISIIGARLGSTSVCGELHQDNLDLVRLTGIHPLTLLWCRSLARWLTVTISVLTIFPLMLYARTLGQITTDDWFAAGCILVMTAVFVAGFAMIATVANVTSNNCDVAAPKSTFHFIIFYHCLFQFVNALVLGINWCSYQSFVLSQGSWARNVSDFMTRALPIHLVYQSITEPEFFSPVTVEYWLHMITGVVCALLASWMMTKLFHASSVEKIPALRKTEERQVQASKRRPRCSERPFFWKDAYVLRGTQATPRLILWLVSLGSVVAIIGTAFISDPFLMKLASALTVCLPLFVQIGIFDELLTVEFREQTWVTLMLLPVDRRWIILEKLRAANKETRAAITPVIGSAAIAAYYEPATVAIAIAVASLASILLIEISILNQLNAKFWWFKPIILVSVTIMVAANAAIWIYLKVLIGFLLTMTALMVVIVPVYAYLDWRLRTWAE
jgi:hypothetical protein